MYRLQNKHNYPKRVIIKDREYQVFANGYLEVDKKSFESNRDEILAQGFMVVSRPEKKETVKKSTSKKNDPTPEETSEFEANAVESENGQGG